MKNIIFLPIFIIFLLSCHTYKNIELLLKCEYSKNPVNIDCQHPHFSWVTKSDTRGQRQTAYQVLVSRSKNNLNNENQILWNSGKKSSSQSSHIEYNGKPLNNNSQYFWKVKIWDKDNQLIESDVAEFSTAFLSDTVWSANWIAADPVAEALSDQGFYQSLKEQYEFADTVIYDGGSVLLRREINCLNDIKRARVFVTGLGFYELYINGEKIGDHVLAPAKTNYNKQILYDTYDVTHQLKNGANALGIHLGNGWFNPYKKWWRPYRMQWFGSKRAILQLHVEYQNGETQIFTTNEQWKYSNGPVTFNCIYDGEIYDANLEQPNWAKPEFDDNEWLPVKTVKAPHGKMISHTMPAIKVIGHIKPVKKHQPSEGVYVYDMGQNFTGWVRVIFDGKKGTKVKLRFAEDINDDNTINTTSNEHAKATAIYILKGDAPEIYESRFTYFGFRYVEITGAPECPIIENVTGCVVHTDCERTGDFECGNETVNKIHKATIWSQKSNMLGYPMDCPQRDERLGWFGDAQVTAEEAMFNFDMPLFYKNWLSGIRENQDEKTGDIPIISPRPYIWDEGVEWSSTYIVLTWLYYIYYGDTQILADHFDTMDRYMQFLDSIATDYILKPGWIGDWGSLVNGWKEGEPESVPTAFYYWNSVILSKMAAVLDKKDKQQKFEKLAQNIKKAFNKKFFDEESNQYNDGSQMANAFPLFLKLVPPEHKQNVLNNLVQDIVETNKGHLTTGVLGSKYMIDALSRNNRADVAWLLATQTGYPSWSDMVAKYTTMCEFWTLKQSHNHVMTGSIDAFFYKTLTGILPLESYPGFSKVMIKPYIPETLEYAWASIQTIQGTISSGWEKKESGLTLNVSVPVNATADVYIPAADPDQVFESGKPAKTSYGIKYINTENNYVIFSIQSGTYKFKVKN